MRQFFKYSIPTALLMLGACGGSSEEPAPAEPAGEVEQAGGEVPFPLNEPISSEEPPTEDAQPVQADLEDLTETAEPPEATGEADNTEKDEPPTDTPDVVEASDAPVPSTGADKIMLVMDGSGSMWGQIDGQSKMEIARGATRKLVDGLPSDAHTGLMAYGHRKKGDCEDIELLQSPAPGATAEIIGAVDAITPTGKTPLSAAVKQAAEALRYEEDRATVILVTDGIETCDLDPCDVGNSLEDLGIDFTAHVIGFGLSEQEGRQVACLAENTGGQYIEASNAGELGDAMEQVAEAVEAEPEPEPELAEATLTVPDEAEIGSVFEVTWTGPDNTDENDYIDLAEPAREDKIGKYLWSRYIHDRDVLEVRAPAEPGTYNVRYVWVNPPHKPKVIASESVEIVDADVVLAPPQSVHVGERFEVGYKGPANKNDYVDIVPSGQTATNTQISYRYIQEDETEGTGVLHAPGEPQETDIRYVAYGSDGKRVLKTVPLTVEDVRAEVAFNPSVALGAVLEVDWTGPDNQNDYIDIVERGFDKTNTQLSYRYTNSGNPAELKVPGEPGEYDVRYIMTSATGERILTRAPLSLTDVEVSLEFEPELRVGDVLEVEWTGPEGRLNYVDIVERGFTKTNTQLTYAYAREDILELKLPKDPGEYDVRFILAASDGEKILITKPLTVTDRDVTLEFSSTIAQGKVLEVEWDGPLHNLNYVDIVEPGFRKTNQQLSYTYARKENEILELQLPAEPGDYDVRFVLSAGDGERVLARKSLTITGVDTSIDAPSEADAGETIEVEWTGPGNSRDFIDVVPRGKKLPKDSIQYAYARRGNILELKMPDEAGEYDIRYIHVGADKRIVTAVVPVEVN